MPTYKVKIEDREYEVSVIDAADGSAQVRVDDQTFEVASAASTSAAAVVNEVLVADSPPPRQVPSAPTPSPRAAGSNATGEVRAPIPGVITKLCVAVGDRVAAGQVVLKLEAMKMENDISAAIAGAVESIAVTEGAEVTDGQLLVVIA